VVVVMIVVVVVSMSVNVVASGVEVTVSRVVYVMLKRLVVVEYLYHVGTASVPAVPVGNA
jgi:hypothetical protein